MKKTYILLTMLFVLLSINLQSKAQSLLLQNSKASKSDRIYGEFSDIVYRAFYNPTYMMTQAASFTMLKIDIDQNGNAVILTFSDSADPSLLKAWEHRPRTDEKIIIGNYAKEKGYKDVSIIIPVSFEPNAPNANKQFSYDQIEALFRFNKKVYSGNSVVLEPIFIRVLSKGNM